MYKLIILFLYSSIAWGYQYYYYDAKKVKVSDVSFRRYVRSQARSIVAEFYSILGKLSPGEVDLTRIRREILQQSTDWQRWKEECPLYDHKCELRLHHFYSRARELDRKILRFQKVNLKRWQEMTPNSHDEVDALLAVSESLDRISTLNYQSLHLIEELLITSGGKGETPFFEEDQFEPLLRLMRLSGDYLLVGLISQPIVKELFSNIWLTFMKNLEEHVVINCDQDYLLDHLADFNIAWNGFHMRVKKDKFFVPPLLPPSVATSVGMMHNRWNWILKLYLKNTNLLDKKKDP